METRETRHYDRRLWLGVGIVLLGVFFLANNFGLINYEIRRYFLRWEMILILLGLGFIAGNRNRSTGIILLVIGSAFYLRDILNLQFSFWQLFWPSLLILIGLMILLRHRLDKDWGEDTRVTGEDVIDEIAIFGGGDRIVNSKQFKGGKVTTIFGGLNYDMLRAGLAPGKNVLDVFCVFGGMKILAPEDWNIKIKVFSIFGGFGEKHRYLKAADGKEGASELIIKGTVIFGGGEVKRYPD